jgi:lipopolysaccharide export system permease protein
MRALLRRSDWLVASAVLGAIGLTWVVLLGFDLVTAFAGKLDDIGDGDFSLNTALLYTLYTLPRRAYELFPHVVLIGCIMGLGSLASTSELTALRAAGLSRLRICLGASLGVFALTAIMVFSGETLGPAGERRAQAETVAAKSQDLVVASWSGLWAREADTFLNAKRGTCGCSRSILAGAWRRWRSPRGPNTAMASGSCSTCAARAFWSAAL